MIPIIAGFVDFTLPDIWYHYLRAISLVGVNVVGVALGIWLFTFGVRKARQMSKAAYK